MEEVQMDVWMEEATKGGLHSWGRGRGEVHTKTAS
jgi:hypothetical protein